MPIEQAQIIHIATSNTNYANDHSFLSARRQIEIKQQQKIQLSITANARQQENEVLSEKQNGHHDAGLFTDELHAILHDTKILSNSQIGLAY
jgi:predicted RNA-binding protein with RPS1 domain